MQGADRREAFLESLLGLSGRQWTVILVLLACANLVVYGTAGWLLYRYVLPPPPPPAIEMAPTPTLRPTFTPTVAATGTVAGMAAVTATAVPLATAELQ